MSRRMFAQFVAVLALAVMALPVMAMPRPTRDSDTTLKGTITLSSPVMFAGKQLPPGNYNVVAKESKVTISRDGKKMGEVSAEMKDAPKAPPYGSVVLKGEQIEEIHFSGKTAYVVLS